MFPQVVLFERVWNWPANSDPKGVGNLVRSFFLIAKQLDHGMISRVIFETPPAIEPPGTMEMLCTKNERVARLPRGSDPMLHPAGLALVGRDSDPSAVIATGH